MGNKKDKDSKHASWDIVYQEKHEEMRRYRDYELSVSSWVITILLAILGFVSATDVFAETGPKLIISFLAAVFTATGILSVLYASAKFKAHQEILFEELEIEPDEYREAWDYKKNTQDRIVRKIGRPKTLIIIVLVSLFLSIMGFLWVI